MRSATEGMENRGPRQGAGAAMLDRIGAFVEPMTRFDRSHLQLLSCVEQVVPVTATQTFTAAFDIQTTDGLGGLPGGVMAVSSASALRAEIDAMLARARTAAANRLSAWTDAHGADTGATPGIADVFASEGQVGYAHACGACNGGGQVDCQSCLGRGHKTCQGCHGQKTSQCPKCHGTTAAPCEGCSGQGGRYRQVEHRGWNAAANEVSVRYEQVWEACHRCGGRRTQHCPCQGGRIACSTCSGKGVTVCTTCHGLRQVTCQTCEGKGKQHQIANVRCTITPELSIDAHGGGDIRQELGAIGRLDRLLSAAHDVTVRSDASAAEFRRVTSAKVAVASATVAAGAHQVTLNGYGPAFDILHYQGVGGALLSGDLEALEAALASNTGVDEALRGVLESETNVDIARHSGGASARTRTADLAGLSARLSGLASADYAERASKAIRKALSRAYRGALMKWPIYALPAPALALPIDWLAWKLKVYRQDTPIILGVMILSFAMAFVGDRWATGQMQRTLSTRADLDIRRLVVGLALSRIWLIAAGIAAVVLAPVCGITGRVLAGY